MNALPLLNGLSLEVRSARGREDRMADVYNAIEEGRYEAAIALIQGGADVGWASETFRWTALHLAAIRAHPRLVSLLVQHRARVEAEDGWKRTPLLRAIGWMSSLSKEEARLECVKLLLQAGANIRHCDKDGNNALHYATSRRQLSIAQHLLTVDPSLCLVKNSAEETALHVAADYTQPAMISLLLQHGARVDDQDNQKQTPLLVAIGCPRPWDIGWRSSPSKEEDRLRCVEVLLQAGANIRHCDENGNNALHYACQSSHLSIVKHLIIADLSLLQVKNKKGKMPSNYAKDDIKAHIQKVEALLKSVNPVLDASIDEDLHFL
ncbi:unnamed protein product, partial [Cyprideis torosa]